MFRIDSNKVLFNRVRLGIKLLELELDSISIILGISCSNIEVLNILDLDSSISNQVIILSPNKFILLIFSNINIKKTLCNKSNNRKFKNIVSKQKVFR